MCGTQFRVVVLVLFGRHGLKPGGSIVFGRDPLTHRHRVRMSGFHFSSYNHRPRYTGPAPHTFLHLVDIA